MRFFGTLLIIGALIGCYFVYQDFWKEEWRARNPWVKRMAPLIRPHLVKAGSAGDAAAASDASFMMIIQMAWQAGEDGYNPLEVLQSAALNSGAEPAEADLIATSVYENLQFAMRMEVFTDLKSAVGMERGEPPLAHAKDWADEPLVVGHILSPLLAPEAAHALPNMRLLPKIVRDMADDRVTSRTIDIAKKWLGSRIITAESYRWIAKKAAEIQGF